MGPNRFRVLRISISRVPGGISERDFSSPFIVDCLCIDYPRRTGLSRIFLRGAGDAIELQSMTEVLSSFHLPAGSVALGSVKSNIGHLKGAAGAAGLLKATLALRDKVLPPSVNCEHPNSAIDFAHSPLYVNTELRPWTVPADTPRRAGLSAFGFGGTNFHAVLEEYIPGRLNGNGKRVSGADLQVCAGPPGPALNARDADRKS